MSYFSQIGHIYFAKERHFYVAMTGVVGINSRTSTSHDGSARAALMPWQTLNLLMPVSNLMKYPVIEDAVTTASRY